MQRRALIETRFTIDTYSTILRALNRNTLRCAERLLDFPVFWHLQVPKSFILVRSLEQMKESGVVQYLTTAVDKAVVRNFVKNATDYATAESWKSSGSDNVRTGLADSILKEAFLLLACGIVLGMCILGENYRGIL